MQTFNRHELAASIRTSIRRLQAFRTACLMGTAPASITVDGHVIKDELEAEGYLYELEAELRELEAGR